MNQLIHTPTDALDQGSDFLAFLETQKRLTTDIQAAWDAIQDEMVKHNVQSLKGDWGYLSLAERKSWKVNGTAPPRFYKQQLDSARLNALHKLGDTLPASISFTTNQYLAKKIK